MKVLPTYPRFTIWIVVLQLVAGSTSADNAPDAFAQAERMGRGVNILGYDPIWEDFDKARFQKRHFEVIRQGGFQTVRINLHGLQHVDGDRVEPAWLETLDWAVEGALAAGLMVILDLHNFTDFAKDPEGLKPKFLSFWRQVSLRFKDAPSELMFEILNEPNGLLTPELWNRYLAEALAIIRADHPHRTVIVGPGHWNKIEYLDALDLPANDRHLIVAVHYYEPYTFTHQGTPWNPQWVELSGVTWGNKSDQRRVVEDFARAQEWSEKHRRPIFLGEFGAYGTGDMGSRVRYTSHVARTAEAMGWAWAYWQFDSDFIVYDLGRERWVEPIWKALVPDAEPRPQPAVKAPPAR